MDKKMLLTVISTIVALLAVTFVTASPWTANTPLYAVRMEQASSKMNFLPTEMNGFTYTSEKGYEISCDVTICPNVEPSSDKPTSAQNPCKWTDPYSTCSGYTCWLSCGGTCETCAVTCPNTCNPTCTGSTCITC